MAKSIFQVFFFSIFSISEDQNLANFRFLSGRVLTSNTDLLMVDHKNIVAMEVVTRNFVFSVKIAEGGGGSELLVS